MLFIRSVYMQGSSNNDTSLDDNEIIEGILRGDPSLFSHLLRRYQNQVYAMIRRRVRDPEASKDLTQETFAKAYHGLSSYRHESQFSTWLIRIALNVSNSYFASRRYKDQLRTVPLEVQSYCDLKLVEEDHAQNEDGYSEIALHKLQLCIARLAPKYRDVVSLCFLERTTHSEAARILDIPESTVTSRMHTALQELRKQYRRQR